MTQVKKKIHRRPRPRGRTMPVWAISLIVVACLAVVISGAAFLISQSSPSPYQEVFAKAKDLDTMGDLDAALALYRKVPADDPQFGNQARLEAERIMNERNAGDRARKYRAAKNWYENNILVFIHKYLDAPKDKPEIEKRIRMEYKADRSSYIRILVRNRLDPYLQDFPDEEDADAVRALREKYLAEWDENTPTVFRDIELEAETWLRIHAYGKAHQLMEAYLSDYPDTRYFDRILSMYRLIQNTFENEWNKRADYVAEMEETGKYRAANKIYDQFLKRCEGYNLPEVQELCAQWTQRFNENEIKLREEATHR